MENRKKAISLIIIGTGLALVVAGYINGEHKSFFQKAIMVCTQCIGLG